MCDSSGQTRKRLGGVANAGEGLVAHIQHARTPGDPEDVGLHFRQHQVDGRVHLRAFEVGRQVWPVSDLDHRLRLGCRIQVPDDLARNVVQRYCDFRHRHGVDGRQVELKPHRHELHALARLQRRLRFQPGPQITGVAHHTDGDRLTRLIDERRVTQLQRVQNDLFRWRAGVGFLDGLRQCGVRHQRITG